MGKNIVIGIIGAGYWGPNLVRNFLSLDNCLVKYVCDLDPTRLENIKKNYPNILTVEDAEQIFLDKEVDAVAIATPVATHFTLAKRAFACSKHVFMEKPMTSSFSEGKDLVELASARSLIFMVDHTFVYTGAVRKIKEFIDSGQLGDLYYFDSERINLGLIRPDVSVLWDLAPHDLSIINYLFRDFKPTSVFATAARHVNSKVDEMARITIKFANGFVGYINVSWLSPVKIRKILIGGSKKMVLYDDLEPSEKVRVYDKGVEIDYNAITPLSPLYRSGDIFIPKLDEGEALLREVKHFIACVEENKQPLTSGMDGLEVVRILECCDLSLKEHREINL